LHRLGNGTQLSWLIDLQRQQIWVWQGTELPIICAGAEMLLTIGFIPGFTVEAVVAMSRQR
jgi:Uma2 family endonuclease